MPVPNHLRRAVPTRPRRGPRRTRARGGRTLPALGSLTLGSLTLGGLLLLPHAVAGQDGTGRDGVRRVSLAEALEAFGEHSLALKIARSDAAEIAGAARQFRAYANPSLSLMRDDLSRGRDRHLEQGVLFSQELEWPGRTAARYRVASGMVSASTARFRGDSIQLAFEVREAYVLAWFAETAELTARQTAAVIRDVTEDAELRLEAGDLSAYEARRLRLERVRAEQVVAEAELRTRDARRRLAALILPDAGLEEIGPSTALEGTPPPVSREEALPALLDRPDLEAAARDLDIARAESDVASVGWIPQPSVGIGYRDHGDGFAGLSLAVDVPLSLFDRGGGRREEASARRFAAAYRLDLRMRLAENDLLATWDRYASSRSRLEVAADDLLADAEALLASATAAYGENEMTLLGLLDAASAFQTGRRGALSMRSTAWIDYYDLLRAMGRAPEEER